MANNPYVNKVVYGNNTLIDLTSDTVTADKLAQGYTAHDSSGAAITGTMSGASLTGKTVTPSASLQVITPNDSDDATLTDISLQNSSGETATATVSLPIVNGKTYRIYGRAKYRWGLHTMTMTFDDEWVCGEPLPYTESGDAPQSPTITLTPTQLSLYALGSLNFTLQSLAIIDPNATYNGLSAVTVNAMPETSVGVATASASSTTQQLQFNNITAEPKAFALIFNGSQARLTNTNNYTTAVVYDGTNTIHTYSARYSTNQLRISSGSASFTYSGTNKRLTISSSSFPTGDYELIYVY